MLLPQLCALRQCTDTDVLSLVACPSCVFELMNPLVDSLERFLCGLSWFAQPMTYFLVLVMLLSLGSQIGNTSVSALFL